MPPTTKQGHIKPIVGSTYTVLKHEFIQWVQHGILGTLLGTKVYEELPFSGPLMLPNKDQVLKLDLLYRDYYGKKNPSIKTTDIYTLVAEAVIRLNNANNSW